MFVATGPRLQRAPVPGVLGSVRQPDDAGPGLLLAPPLVVAFFPLLPTPWALTCFSHRYHLHPAHRVPTPPRLLPPMVLPTAFYAWLLWSAAGRPWRCTALRCPPPGRANVSWSPRSRLSPPLSISSAKRIGEAKHRRRLCPAEREEKGARGVCRLLASPAPPRRRCPPSCAHHSHADPAFFPRPLPPFLAPSTFPRPLGLVLMQQWKANSTAKLWVAPAWCLAGRRPPALSLTLFFSLSIP